MRISALNDPHLIELDTSALLGQAEAAFARRDFEAASSIAAGIVEAEPSSVKGWAFLALARKLDGALAQATRDLERAVAVNPRSVLLHNMLGSLAHEGDDRRKAEFHWRASVTIDPSFAAAWSNLAKSYLRGADYTNAELAFRSAVAADGEEPGYLLDLAGFLAFRGRFAEAEGVLGRADALINRIHGPRGWLESPSQLLSWRSGLAEQMANGYLKSREPLQALGHLEHAVSLKAGPVVQDQFIQLILGARFSQPHPTLKPILARALEEGWAEPADIGRLATHILSLEEDFITLLARFESGEDNVSIIRSSLAVKVLTEHLLLTLLRRSPITDSAIERLLTYARRAILMTSTDPDLADQEEEANTLRPFVTAMALQSFINEFAFDISDDEKSICDGLVQRCEEKLQQPGSGSGWMLALLGSYRPLHTMPDSPCLLEIAWPAELEPLITQQVREPAEDLEVRDGLKALTPVMDPVSRAVRDQYEANPFPRWVQAPRPAVARRLRDWIGATFPIMPRLRSLAENSRYDGLVAGCGTGQELARLSRMFLDVDYLAIDLSRASLAYAVRKMAELRVRNIDFASADILELRNLDRRFDLVVSAGVLHHLEHPDEGLRTLRDLARPGGALLIALYSSAGRRHVVGARAHASGGGYGVTPDELRRYRADVLNLTAAEAPWRDDLLRRDDFYSLSMLRDLIFHQQETCFTIAELGDILARLSLKFCGFSVDRGTSDAFKTRFGKEADPLSLSQWETFEFENPDTFWHMYHFLVEAPLAA